MELSQMIALGGALILILIFSIYIHLSPRAMEFFEDKDHGRQVWTPISEP